jgi:DNA-binding MarR family transcriptional regulator
MDGDAGGDSRETPRGVAMRDLADHLQVTPAFVTHESNVLIRARLIEKQNNPQDRRSTLLSLSDQGARLVSTLLPEVRAVNDLFFARLTAPAFKRAQELMGLLLDGSAHALGHVASGRAIKGSQRRGLTKLSAAPVKSARARRRSDGVGQMARSLHR